MPLRNFIIINWMLRNLILTFSQLILSNSIVSDSNGENLSKNISSIINDDIPWSSLEELTRLEKSTNFSLKVIVLTMNRPESLERLLASINRTYFEYPGDKISVEIHVDKSHGWLYEDTVKIAKEFQLPRGRGSVRHVVYPANRGLRAAWFESWTPGVDGEYCLILEDDLELSSQWYSWLRKAWLTYSHRTDLAGIALSRQYLVLKKPEREQEILNNHEPFLYRLVGTWGFSPHPTRWAEFLDWFNSVDSEAFDPYVPGMATSDWLHMHTWQGRRHMTWEQWHVYHSDANDLFTLYHNLPDGRVLLANWREAGVHSRTSPGYPDYQLLTTCPIQLQEFPAKLRKYDWDATEIVSSGPH